MLLPSSILGVSKLSYLAHMARSSLPYAIGPFFCHDRSADGQCTRSRCFYHQLLRRGCGSIAHLITYTILQLGRGGFIGRYLFISLTFAVSGVFHLCSDMSQGIGPRESGALHFFCIQALGIMIEDGIGAAARPTKEVAQKGNGHFRWRKAAGFTWVLIWLTWTTPTWTYPMMQRSRGEPILPFSLVAVLVGDR